MRHLTWIALFITCFASLGRAQVDGGNPPLLLYYGSFSHLDPSPSSLAIASDGTQFVAYSAPGNSIHGGDVFVLRSTDRGNTWEVWGTIRDLSGDEGYDNPRVEIIGRGSGSEELIVAYEYSRSGIDAIEVAYADAADASPAWTIRRAIEYTNQPGPYPNLEDWDLAVGDDGQTTVAVAAAIEVDEGDVEWRYNVSLNSSFAFGAEQLLDAQTVGLDFYRVYAGIAIAFHDRGGDDRVHAVLGFGGLHDTDDSLDFGEVKQTGSDDWGIFAAFDPLVTVATRDHPIAHIDLAADLDGDELVFVSDWIFEAFASTNAGANWTPITLPDGQTIDEVQVRRDSGQFVMWGERYIYDVIEYRPDASITGDWSPRVLMHYDWNLNGRPDSTDDPSQPGETATVATVEFDSDHDPGVWYNATWRDGIGYGVLEDLEPQSAEGEFTSAPAIGDVDADGDREIVVTSEDPFSGEHWLEIFQSSSAVGAPIGVEMLESAACSAPALFDVDDDGDLEIFVGEARGGVRGFDHQLGVLDGWPVDLPGNADTWVSVGPVTGYSHGEIVAATQDRVHLISPLGDEREGWPYVDPAGGAVVGRAALGDVDGDGSTEVVAAFTTGVMILDADGTRARLFDGPWVPSTGVSLADLDDDGDLEIIGPMSDGTLLVSHHDGTFIDPAFPFDTGMGAPLSAVSVAEVETAGEPVLCFTVADRVFAMRPDGSALPGYPHAPTSIGSTLTEPIIARVARQNTARPQLVYGSNNGYVHMLTAAGEIPRDWPHFLDDGATMPPAISDVDGDGITETVLAVGELLYVLDSGATGLGSAARRWPQSGHDRMRSGCADCAPNTPTSVDPGAPTPNTSLVDFTGVWPNPASGPSTFAFALSSRAHVELSVFDVRGRRVRQVISAPRDAGAHQITWDASDASGRPVASGTYFARMRVLRGAESTVRVQAISVVR